MNSPVKVLLADAAVENTLSVAAALRANGMEVQLCEKNGAAVLSILENSTPDVLIMDAFLQHIDALGVVSRLNKTMKPLLDDFAQICGPKIKVASPEKCAKAIKGKNAVLIKDQGALCCGSVEGDAQAVDMIMSKSCLTLLTTKIFGKAKAINPIEALLMRIVYLKKYSKQASE